MITLEFSRFIYREKTSDGKFKFEAENSDDTIELDEDFIGSQNIPYLQDNKLCSGTNIVEDETIVTVRSHDDEQLVFKYQLYFEC